MTVTGASPVVDTTSANVNVTLSEQLLQTTPGGRDIWALVEYKVPRLVITRPDVGGTPAGFRAPNVARGTASTQNTQFLNGVNVGDPAAIGFAGFYYDYDAFEQIQVSTGAHDISVPTGGVFLNMVTKTGGNRWAGQASCLPAERHPEPERRRRDAALGFRDDTNSVDFVSDVSFNAGGPLIRDKLRFFGSFRDWRVHVNVPAAFPETVLDETNITSGLANLTWQINQSNKFTAFDSLPELRQAEPLPASPTTLLVEDSDLQRGRHLPRVPDAVELDAHRPLLHRRALRLQQDLLPALRQGHRPDAARPATGIRTRSYLAEPSGSATAAGHATSQYFVDSFARRPPRVALRVRPCARAGRQDPQERRRRPDLPQRHRTGASR